MKKLIADKEFLGKVLAHFADNDRFVVHTDNERYAGTGRGTCALFLDNLEFDAPYTTSVGPVVTQLFHSAHTVIGYIRMHGLRSFLLEIARERLSADVPQCLYAERMKDESAPFVRIGGRGVAYWDMDLAWRMLFAIGAESVRVSSINSNDQFLLLEPTVDGEAVATVVVSVVLDAKGGIPIPLTNEVQSNDPDGFSILAPTNFALLEQERAKADGLRSMFRKLYAVTLVKYAVVNVYANNEKEAKGIAIDNVDDYAFGDIEVDSIEADPTIDEHDDVYGKEGLLDPEEYMKEE